MDNVETSDQNIPNGDDKKQKVYKRLVRLMWFGAICGVLFIAGMFIFLSYQDLPTFEELENPNSNLASEVYAANTEVLGRYYIENRIPVTFDQLSPNLVNALVATEDERYYKHSGIDGWGLMRVFGKTLLLNNKSAGGASTITQQLAKMLFTEKPGSGLERVIQKFKEWIIAVKLERSYTKQEIMAMYLNKFSFINDAYGIKAAAEIYFGTSQDSLSINQAATLVGMLKNPSLFNPIRRPDTTRHRRMVVLHQMTRQNFISPIQYDSLRKLPMDMSSFKRTTHADGLAPYFRMELRKELNRILAKDEAKKSNGEKYNIYRDGLKIYTTLDPVIQKHAEDAMLEHMTSLQKKFERVWRKADPWTYVDPIDRDEKEPKEIETDLKSRARALKRDIRGTSRYQTIRARMLNPVIAKVAKQIDDFQLRDVDIERMLDVEKEKGYMARLTSKKIIGSKLAMKYRRVMDGELWESLKENWEDFQTVSEKNFDKPAKMRVFAYNDAMEKDTIMSPLDSIKYHRMFLQFGSVSVDPATGFVKAWVGGINHKYFQYDHVTSDRQVGSTFKPFIYATAIAEQGISPCFVVYDLPYTIHVGEANFKIPQDWTPNNADGRYSGKPFTLFKGLQWSKNTVSVFLMKQLGDSEPVRNLVHNMGLDKNKKRSNGQYRVPKQPSICLGSSDLTVLELTGAYTTFANDGLYSKPIFISHIEDKNGREIYREEIQERRALNSKPNFVMIQMLKKVMNQGLPGFSSIKSEVAGKTGTTNDYVDGWFMGMTPDLVTGTWVGGDQRWIRFLSLRDGIGAKMARPFYAKFLKKLESDPEADYDVKERFNIPRGDIGIVLDCEEYGSIVPVSGTGEDDFWQEEEDENFGDDPFGDEEEIERDSTSIFEDEDFD